LSRLRYNRREAVQHLQSCCPSLGSFIEQHGRLGIRVAKQAELFTALAEAIVYQQLSGKAAGTIYGRFSALYPDDLPDARSTLQMDIPLLRSVGLSQNKALAILDLSAKTLDGSLWSMKKINRHSDQEVIDNLVQVRGVGPWTAQMLLIFTLGRPDVMPAADLGVQKGVQAVYRMKSLPAPEQVLRRTRHLAPYRSAASWYFWRAADTVLMK
jgi:3-methyladenine DNA glycosylase/8-oxoguanine DNA glycosylase